MKSLKKFYLSLIVIILLLTSSCSVFATDIEVNSNVNVSEINVSSPSVILLDSKTGKILYSKNPYRKMYPASTTKLMTAILALENCKLTDTATVSHEAIFSIPSGYSHASLKEGEELTIEQLLNVLLIPSANDAAIVLAEHIAGSVDNFSIMMNNKAKELGCLNTNFINPNGIHNKEHWSTAYDLSLIGRYAMKFPDIMRISKVTRYTLPVTNKYKKTDRIFHTTNGLINSESMNKDYYSYTTGLKTGYTDSAGYCIVSTAKKGEQELLAVVLNGKSASSRYSDCKTLFNYGFNNYSYNTLNKKGSVIKQIEIGNASKETKNLNVIIKKDIKALMKNSDTKKDIEPNIEINSDLKAPIAENEVVGKITYTIDNISYSSDLIAENTVYASSFETLLFRGLLIFLILSIVFMLLKSSNKSHKRASKNKGNKRTRKSSKVVELDSDFYYGFSRSKKRKKRGLFR